ncbi:MAG: nucleotidyltransferase family protein, partial [Clostridia bacterium]|nr:nucleotidyltransferase family protein [Clostridia bacterium]
MKIGLTICEYNPFHNGHLYSINTIKQTLKPDALIVIMSGNFTQRGEI